MMFHRIVADIMAPIGNGCLVLRLYLTIIIGSCCRILKKHEVGVDEAFSIKVWLDERITEELGK